LRVPDQLFQREPTHTLDKSTFDLAAINQRGDGLAYIVQNVGAPQTILARKSVNLYLTHGCAIGKVIKGTPLHGLSIVVDLGRSVVALGKQGNALKISSFNQIGKSQVF